MEFSFGAFISAVAMGAGMHYWGRRQWPAAVGCFLLAVAWFAVSMAAEQ